MAISRQKEARSRDYALLLFRMTSRVLYSARYHRQHCTLHAFEQFGALYMHNHDDKYQARPGFKPGTYRLQAPVDMNEPSGPATDRTGTWVWHSLTWRGPGSDTHWHDGDMGLILADRAGTCVMTWRGPGSDTHWHGRDWVPALSVSVRSRSPLCQWVSDPGPRSVSECQTQVPALSVSVRLRSPPCQWVSHPGPRPVSECHTQVPALSVSVRPRSPLCQWVSDPGPRPVGECHTQVPRPVSECQTQVSALSVSVSPRSPPC